jgi:hypothetical protein
VNTTWPTASLSNPTPVGPESGGDAGRETPAALDSDVYRDMRWCIDCGGEQVFVEVFEFEGGRVGVCLGCGSERVIRFSRMVA